MAEYGLGKIGCGTGSYQPSLLGGKTPPKENDILKRAVDAAKKKYPNIFIFKVHGGGYQRSGVPDVYVAINGRSIWVEFKRPGADTTKLQYKTLQKLDSQGVWVGTAESKETFLDIIRQVLEF